MNRTILIGRLVADPELRTTPNGIATTQIRLAINRGVNANGERLTDFINVVVWRRQAENVSKYCSKGSLVAVEGRVQSRSYDAQDGTKRYVTEVVADNVTFLGSRRDSGSGYTPSEPASATSYASSEPVSYASQGPMMPVEDNVPFPEGEEISTPTTDVSGSDPFENFGDEVVLSDDDLPF